MAGNDNGNQYVTVGNAAKVTGISERTLRYWINAGKLAATGGKRGRLVRLADVQAIAELTGKAPATNKATTATATSAVTSAGNDPNGNHEATTAGNDPGNTAIVSERTQQQAAVMREILQDMLRELLDEQAAAFRSEIAGLREQVGELAAELERREAQQQRSSSERIGELERETGQLESERDALQAQLEALRSLESDDTAQDEPQAMHRGYRIPERVERKWWEFWKKGRG